MALSIGVAVGAQIEVGDSMVIVQEIMGKTMALQIDHHPPVLVSEMERTEILPDVFVFVGARTSGTGGCANRLAFEAPPHIKINHLRRGHGVSA